MTNFPLELLKLKTMASSHLCLDLTEKVNWEQFPGFAEQLIAIIDARSFDKAESVEMRIWHLQLPTCQIKLVFDDFPQMVSLESDTPQGDGIIKTLAEQLMQIRERKNSIGG